MDENFVLNFLQDIRRDCECQWSSFSLAIENFTQRNHCADWATSLRTFNDPSIAREELAKVAPEKLIQGASPAHSLTTTLTDHCPLSLHFTSLITYHFMLLSRGTNWKFSTILSRFYTRTGRRLNTHHLKSYSLLSIATPKIHFFSRWQYFNVFKQPSECRAIKSLFWMMHGWHNRSNI